MNGIDWQAAGALIGALGTVAAGMWAWIERARAGKAATDADIAQSHAEESIYKMMTERLTALEKDVSNLCDALAQERNRSHALERHISRLECMIRASGTEPPIFEVAQSTAPKA